MVDDNEVREWDLEKEREWEWESRKKRIRKRKNERGQWSKKMGKRERMI
jgi:hypothetical protein